ncbi:MAG: hypothetical protein NDI61_14130 [Bdellovibrionaceae bacterium]|nr:hypothetical protein [Pseudobdellovibrionaceae bacterium]
MSHSEDRRQRPARAGDGTLPDKKDRPDANWFGSSKRPSEEFINDHRSGDDERPLRIPSVNEVTGEITKENSGNHRASTAKTAVPPSVNSQANDVFPAGGPESQSDG